MTDTDFEPNFQLLFEATPSPLLVLDPEFHIIAVNEAYVDATMTVREEIIGRHIFDVFPDNPDDPEATGERNLGTSLETVRRTREPDTMAVQKHDIQRPDGSFEVRYWSPKNVPVLDEKGELHAIIHRVEDITEVIELKEQGGELESQVTELEAELYERSQEIQHGKQRLEEAYAKLVETEEQIRLENRRKDEFLAMLSHEIRNPMAAISAAASLLAEDAPRAQMDDALATIERQVRHMKQLVDDLIDVSRIMQDRIDLQRKSCRLADLLEDSLDATRGKFDERDQRVEASMTTEPVVVKADPTRLVQVFTNLLDNASKYGSEGGQIRLEAEYDDGEAVVRVIDDGIGIDAELLPHVFDRFKQADTSLERSEGGIGLGLTLVDALVDMHGGSVRVESEGRGQGSTFEVRLPASLGDQDTPETDEPVSQTTVSHRILLVDDNAGLLESLRRLLELDNHEVETAEDGEEAIKAATAFKPDIAVVDIGLPGLDGYAVAERLRQLDATREANLYAMTGYGRENDRRLSEEAGFDKHLVKPVDPTELRRLVNETGD